MNSSISRCGDFVIGRFGDRLINRQITRSPNHKILPFAALIIAAAALPGCGGNGNGNAEKSMAITQHSWGSADNKPVRIYTLTNDNGFAAKITNYGGIVTEFHMPDRKGTVEDIVLGFESLGGYLAGSPYFGATVGRVANRIQAGQFTLNGQDYQLAVNNGPNHLHGGEKGWDKVVWDAGDGPRETDDGQSLRMTYHSPDGEEGYPGAVDAIVVYTLTHDNELRVEMEATASEENAGGTPVNMVHHSYWNLAGHDSGTVFDHVLQLDCSRYTPTDDTGIPTGEIAPVEGTPYDFTTAKTIRRDFTQTPQVGYDLNLVVDDFDRSLRRNARVTDPSSGRTMEIWSNMPGIQFYGGTFLDGVTGKGGATYDQFTGFCLETQYFPDSINKRGQPGWPDPVLMPGETYRHEMVHRFSSED